MEYDDRLSIPTPEGVAVELQLAGLGSRTVAGVVDLALKMVLVLLVYVALAAVLGVAAAFVVVPLIALTMLAYDVCFELLAGGRTPGKRWSRLRVVRSSGRPVDLMASVTRNALRLVDGLPLSYVPTMVSIIATTRNQRLGDLAADTIVVREPRPRGVAARVPVPAAATAVPAAAAARWDVSAIGADDLATVRAFLERRGTLSRAARARLAAQLDGALRPRVAGSDEPDPERFLERLYEAKRG